VTCWTSYRDFWFADGSAELQSAEANRITEIAVYMKRNPSLQIGIDASTDSRSMDASNPNLSDRRAKAIREALVEAGVPANRISVGAYGDVELRRDRRVEVLIASAD